MIKFLNIIYDVEVEKLETVTESNSDKTLVIFS